MRMQQLKFTHGKTKTNFFRNNDTNIFNVYYDKEIFESTLRKSRLIRWDEERYSLTSALKNSQQFAAAFNFISFRDPSSSL